MKFTKKTRVYDTRMKSYQKLGFVGFRYTGQQIVKNFAKSDNLTYHLLSMDVVIYDPSTKTVVAVYGPNVDFLDTDCPLNVVEMP